MGESLKSGKHKLILARMWAVNLLLNAIAFAIETQTISLMLVVVSSYFIYANIKDYRNGN